MDSGVLIDALLEGAEPSELVDGIISNEDLEEKIRKGTFRRPLKRRFGRRGPGVNPYTGKRKDPRLRMKMRQLARRFKSKRAAARRKSVRRLKVSGFFKKLGKLAARLRR